MKEAKTDNLCLIFSKPFNLKETPLAKTQPKYPPGIPYIIGNEFAERFSYYGMKTILVVFMTQYLMSNSGTLDPMSEADAKYWYHMFSMANYFFPIIGAIISDIFWGKYKTIINLSIVYCLGHLFLGLFETRFGLAMGLTLIAIGSGGIKPCVSAHVGDQFSEKNKSLLTKMFSNFYLAINIGAATSSLLTPVLLEIYGPHIAFGLPGVLMLIATIIFWMGRNKFVAMPPVGIEQYKRDLLSPQGKKALKNLSLIYLFVSIFWSLFDQTGSSWVLQAQHMDRWVNLGFVQFELLSSQIQAFNPVLIIILIPTFAYVVYPFANRFFDFTALRRMSVGFFVAAASFALCAVAQSLIDGGGTPSILWQFFAYFLITIAEILISITALEFAYTQAPHNMKSFIMGFYLLSISLGNFVTAMVNHFIQNPDGSSKLAGAAYFWFFVVLVSITGFIFMFISRHYKEEIYLQSREKLG
ncbi:MAG: MFS transporter [Gemmatimonadetes bacterium]|nr:MAG: MFS transporter [Gemmatimonadota bacterium]